VSEVKRLSMDEYQEILQRWGPNWRQNGHKLLPWWLFAQERPDPVKPATLFWERADRNPYRISVTDGMRAHEVMARMLRVDLDTPMQEPPSMPLQEHEGGMLVYGPTCYGMNVPWCPLGALPQDLVDMAQPPPPVSLVVTEPEKAPKPKNARKARKG
jgi:hypothetical protein